MSSKIPSITTNDAEAGNRIVQVELWHLRLWKNPERPCSILETRFWNESLLEIQVFERSDAESWIKDFNIPNPEFKRVTFHDSDVWTKKILKFRILKRQNLEFKRWFWKLNSELRNGKSSPWSAFNCLGKGVVLMRSGGCCLSTSTSRFLTRSLQVINWKMCYFICVSGTFSEQAKF